MPILDWEPGIHHHAGSHEVYWRSQRRPSWLDHCSLRWHLRAPRRRATGDRLRRFSTRLQSRSARTADSCCSAPPLLSLEGGIAQLKRLSLVASDAVSDELRAQLPGLASVIRRFTNPHE